MNNLISNYRDKEIVLKDDGKIEGLEEADKGPKRKIGANERLRM